MYTILKKLLFQLDPERAHAAALSCLQLSYRLKLSQIIFPKLAAPRTLMGLTFPNPIGLAAGLDKNGDYIDALAALGFGFIEMGTITPKPQIGNPKPRLFRLEEQQAIINRMGFNNKGLEYVANKLEKINYRGILGINLGKNRDTPLEKAKDDYVLGFQTLAKFASYIVINISSPNTPGLRDLQSSQFLNDLLMTLKKQQAKFALTEKKYIPLVVKISPDLTQQELEELAQTLITCNIDGVIATNTTMVDYAQQKAGLSGLPLHALNLHVLKILIPLLKNANIPVIASGGIMNAQMAQEKLQAGASLLQLYSGFIYHGPKLIKDVFTCF